jgi:hypothetical protein
MDRDKDKVIMIIPKAPVGDDWELITRGSVIAKIRKWAIQQKKSNKDNEAK